MWDKSCFSNTLGVGAERSARTVTPMVAIRQEKLSGA
jgi:hypothetical protein